MTREFPPELRDVASWLNESAGSFLDSVVREPRSTCSVCFAPVDGYLMCSQCHKLAQRGVPCADRVGILCYAVEPDFQMYRVARGYKAARPGPSHRGIMSALLTIGLRGHTTCAGAVADLPVDGWLVVPSTHERTALGNMVGTLTRTPERELTVRFCGRLGERIFAPEHWRVEAETVPEHVLVIDDSWVTGAHAQSVAAALKHAGARQVSIFTVTRILDPNWPPNRTFIHEHLGGGTFDGERCPWTDANCPE